jgi:hypothetical protein
MDGVVAGAWMEGCERDDPYPVPGHDFQDRIVNVSGGLTSAAGSPHHPSSFEGEQDDEMEDKKTRFPVETGLGDSSI